ncbi:hypothetical protein, partial [Enterococcus faecalis]|uniref:hypothetical protein n=1 Tax=Enterococcus faecalis TaxID=1351 RepID=UPI002A36F4ED
MALWFRPSCTTRWFIKQLMNHRVVQLGLNHNALFNNRKVTISQLIHNKAASYTLLTLPTNSTVYVSVVAAPLTKKLIQLSFMSSFFLLPPPLVSLLSQ